jgi:hypothetical protein
MTGYKDWNVKMNQDIFAIVDVVSGLKGQMQSLIDSVSNAQGTGFVDKMNCAFVGADLSFLVNNLCDKTISSFFALSWISGVIAVLASLLSIGVFCLGIVVHHHDPDSKGYEETSRNTTNRPIFEADANYTTTRNNPNQTSIYPAQ